MKLKHVWIQRDETPDHIIQEVTDATIKISEGMYPIIKDIPPQIQLAAFGDFFVVLMGSLVIETPENLRTTAIMTAKALIENMERYIKMRELEK